VFVAIAGRSGSGRGGLLRSSMPIGCHLFYRHSGFSTIGDALRLREMRWVALPRLRRTGRGPCGVPGAWSEARRALSATPLDLPLDPVNVVGKS